MNKPLLGAALTAALCISLGACASDKDDPKPAPSNSTPTRPAPTSSAPSPSATPTRPSPVPTSAPPSETAAPTPEARLRSTDTPAEEATEEVSYRNCSDVRAAGAAPIRRGEPGYSSSLDRDGDGIACDN